jgi:hypothetical protein
MDTITIPKEEYDNLLRCRNIVENLESEIYYVEARKISDLVKSGKMKVYSQEEVMRE